MAQFSIETVETLDYDFTAAPSNSGKGKCKGKGTIPEPTQPMLEAYSAATKALFQVEKKEDVEKKLDSPEEVKEKSAQLLAITAELCQNTPSKEDLEELPPRILRAFLKWIFREIADPEVGRGDTPR